MKHILFVDDEPNVLEGLKRMLFPMQREWQMSFASSGAQALEMMQEQGFDVIVTDMRMPGMDGAQLLSTVRTQHPDTVRFVLTGQSDNETLYRSVGKAHQFLSKPCKPTLLKECVDRALALRDLLANERLKAVVSQIVALPPVPHLYAQLCKELQSEDASVADVGHIIESDLAMTAKILQLVNSAFFGLRQPVSTATRAASLLGLDTIKALVLMVGLFSPIEKTKLPPGFSMDLLYRHSTAVGACAKAINESENGPKDLFNDAYAAGLLHDSGVLVLAAACQEDYTHVFDYATVNEVLLTEAEKELLGCTHAEIGAYLLGIWGLPNPIVEAVAYHHRPGDCVQSALSPLTAIHVGDALAFEQLKGMYGYPLPQVDRGYLKKIGLEDRRDQWQAACVAVGATGEG